jgi:hypothetical protein
VTGNLVGTGSQLVGLGGGLVTSGLSFSTNFPSIQNPLSSPWVNINTTGFTKMQVASAGKCYGTNTGSTFDDAYAHLSGWDSFLNQRITCVVGLAPGLPNDGISREIEFHFRVNSETATSIKLYEVDFQYNTTGVPLVRWDGTSGSFTVASGSFGLNSLLALGDVLDFQILGNVISGKQNGVSCGSVNIATDPNIGGTVYSSGNPGIGAFIRPGANNSDVYFESVAMNTL